MRETGTGQQVAQSLDSYTMTMTIQTLANCCGCFSAKRLSDHVQF
jgi:hypothetical protein